MELINTSFESGLADVIFIALAIKAAMYDEAQKAQTGLSKKLPQPSIRSLKKIAANAWARVPFSSSCQMP